MKNNKLEIACVFADSILKFGTEIDIFIKHHINWKLSHLSIALFNAAFRNQFWCKIFFRHGI